MSEKPECVEWTGESESGAISIGIEAETDVIKNIEAALIQLFSAVSGLRCGDD